MIIPDSNLLLYAYNSDVPFQKKAADWLSNILSGNETVGLCPVVLYSFIRIGTNPKAFTKPLSIEEATDHVLSWMEVPATEYISSELDDFSLSMDLLLQAGTGGNLTTDAQIAALGLKYQAVIHTADTDFVRFPKVKWHNPILETEN
jgi:toxin-antitoxin system PIN domain toxin